MLPQLSVCGQICCGKNLLSLSCCCKLQKFVGMMSHSTVLLSDLYQHSTLVTYYIRHCHTVFLAIYSPLGAETQSKFTVPFSLIQFWWAGADDSAPRGSMRFVTERTSGNVEVLWAGPVWKCMAVWISPQTAFTLNPCFV